MRTLPTRKRGEEERERQIVARTNLCNERPAWLGLAHRKLDAAAAAYGR